MNTSIKTIFLDVDGTLVADKGVVPPSAKEAIQKARNLGHKVILCTGRAMSELYDHILEINFDGIVACGGNYVVCDNQVLFERTIPVSDLKELYAYFDKHGIHYYAEANSGLYASEGCDAQLVEISKGLSSKHVHSMDMFRHHLIKGQSLIREDVTKVSFLGSNHPFETLRKNFEGRFELFDLVVPLFGENSGEISILGTDKTVGMDVILKHYQLSTQDSIAIGDGNNDLSMLNYVQMGVAMGNATELLKNVAHYITDDVNNDGLAKAFEHLNLVKESV